MLLLEKIEKYLNKVLELDEDSLSSLNQLSGKVISLELLNTDFCIYILPFEKGVQLRSLYEDDVNVKIRGTPPDVLTYMLKTRTKSADFAGSIEVIGDVGLAQDFQAIVFNLNLDWEEQLSRWFGDTVAHQMARVLKEIGSFGANASDKFQQDVSEYLRFETEMTMHSSEMNEFVDAVDTLRNDTERLKMRINRLEIIRR
jgi:ubiquinone biosynthesis accessory factor UbiJ